MVWSVWSEEVWLPPNITWEYFQDEPRSGWPGFVWCPVVLCRAVCCVVLCCVGSCVVWCCALCCVVLCKSDVPKFPSSPGLPSSPTSASPSPWHSSSYWCSSLRKLPQFPLHPLPRLPPLFSSSSPFSSSSSPQVRVMIQSKVFLPLGIHLGLSPRQPKPSRCLLLVVVKAKCLHIICVVHCGLTGGRFPARDTVFLVLYLRF